MKIFAKEEDGMDGMRKEDGEKGKEAFILEREGPLIAKTKEGERARGYYRMPDGSLVFDQSRLAETSESYRDYFR